jgi:hypothetical protein
VDITPEPETLLAVLAPCAYARHQISKDREAGERDDVTYLDEKVAILIDGVPVATTGRYTRRLVRIRPR